MTEQAPGLRILYLVNAFPWPLTSGYLRHYFLIRELHRRGHRVSLLAIVPTDFGPSDRAALEPFTERIVTVASDRRGRSLRRRISGRIRSLVRGEAASRRLGEEAATLLRNVPHDVVLFSGKRTYPALRAAADLPLVADLCDATSSRVRGSLRYARPARIPVLLVEYLEVRRIERALVKQAAHLLFASVRDRDALLDAPDRGRATVVSNGVDIDFWRRPDGVGLGRHEIVFTGAMDYPPNTDAALLLIGEILPRVQAEIPDAHLSIVGRDPTAALVEAGRAAGVTVTGLVPDIRPYLAAATVFAAPLRFGAGIQNKLLEALAMDVPIVASPNAAAGLVTVDGARPPLTVADGPEAFAAGIVEWLRTADADSTPLAVGRAYVERNFGWTSSGERLDMIVRDAAGSASDATESAADGSAADATEAAPR